MTNDLPSSLSTTIQALILDMDGVIWRDGHPIGDLPAIFNQIKQRGYKVILATNNATRSSSQYLEKISRLGVNLQSWQIINSAQATAHYLEARFPDGGPVYIVGETGLAQTLASCGFHHVSDQREVLAVVVALDRQISYKKLTQASLYIRKGAPFVATNPDRTFPTPDGQVPGAGSIVAAIEAASDTKPTIIGKPAPEMYRLALDRLGTKPTNTLVVGDRLETDIAGAQAFGCYCALVLSGVTSMKAAQFWGPPPNIIARDLSEVIKMI